MEPKWRYCTRPVCRLRSDVSRDRQIYTRKRRIIGGGKQADPVREHDYLNGGAGAGGQAAPPPGRYCAGLCEPEPPPERTLTEDAGKRPMKR